MTADLSRYSVNKSPSSYDEYHFTLPDLYQKVSKEELQEEDAVRKKSLMEMRKWIASNPHIRKCRTDAKFLLRFLRFRQFSVPMACEVLEKYLALREMYPKWFKNLDCRDPVMKKILQSLFLTYLGQDSAGHTVVLMQYGLIDDQEFDAIQSNRIVALVVETMLELEETQIGGWRVLVDYRDTTLEHCKKWNSTSFKIVMDAYSRAFPIRFEDIHAAKLPKFAVPFVEVFLSFANPKLREKIFCHSTIQDLEMQFEDSLKPTTYGGVVDLEKLNLAFLNKLEEYRDVILGLDDMEVDIEYYSSFFDDENGAPDQAVLALFNQLGV